MRTHRSMGCKWLFLVLLASSLAYGQNVRVDDVAFSFVQNSPFLQSPVVTVNVCTNAACTITSPAALCSSQSDTGCSVPNPITGDNFGNYGYWVAPQLFGVQETVSRAGFNPYTKLRSTPCQPESTCSVALVTLLERTAPSGVIGSDILYGDSTLHRPRFINNNGSAATVALQSDNLAFFAATTSAQLAGLFSDETGSGSLVFANAPALSSPTTTGTDNGAEGLNNKTANSPIINGTPTGTGIPTYTLKKGSGAGNYTSASTSYVQVDATNLLFTVTIPTGWKLAVFTRANVTSSTAAVLVGVAIADGGTVLVEDNLTPATTGTVAATSSLMTVITGNGASHTIDLRFKTSNASDSVLLANVSTTVAPSMVFIMSPSN